MKLMKKVVLSLSILFTMCIALVIGCVGNSSSKSSKVLGDNNTSDTHVVTDIVEKPTTYTYAPGDVMVKRGGNTISFNYSPSVNATEDTPTTVAYEYCFGNSMNRATAVNLKEIDTTDVTVSYAWSLNTKLDTTQSITTYTNYQLQRLNNYGDEVYIYVFVTPTNETIPTTFTSSVVWYYGIPYEMPIFNNVTNEVTYQTIVDGQKIDKNTLTPLESFTRTEIGPLCDEDGYYEEDGEIEVTYYFDGWFLDKEYTQLVEEDDVKPGQKVYARYHNIEFGRTDIMTYDDKDEEYILGDCYDYYDDIYYLELYNVVVPTIYDDGDNGEARVTIIGDEAFYGNSGKYGVSRILTISLPSTITTIGNNAFEYCYRLTSITLSRSLTTIGDEVFYSCNDLTSITLPSSLTTIGNNAFNYCSSLTSITIPSSLTTIGEYAFSYCTSLTSIVVEKGNSVYDSRNNCNALIETATNTLIQGCNNTIIPNDIEIIGNNAFYRCTSLTSVDLSKCTNLTTIGTSAFSACTSLTSITLPSSLTTIGAYAFANCRSLTSITLPSSVTKIGQYAFQNSGLTSLTIQGGGTWYKSTSSSYTAYNDADKIDLSNSTTNVTYFTKSKSNGGYVNYYFYRKVN
ncbi:MAG: leucine-rich repeat domain-containing protein [Clostridia bacterium]|nr:leucine-rich repeat domain-containing protein [Clostridia bacterium]